MSSADPKHLAEQRPDAQNCGLRCPKSGWVTLLSADLADLGEFLWSPRTALPANVRVADYPPGMRHIGSVRAFCVRWTEWDQ